MCFGCFPAMRFRVALRYSRAFVPLKGRELGFCEPATFVGAFLQEHVLPAAFAATKCNEFFSGYRLSTLRTRTKSVSGTQPPDTSGSNFSNCFAVIPPSVGGWRVWKGPTFSLNESKVLGGKRQDFICFTSFHPPPPHYGSVFESGFASL